MDAFLASIIRQAAALAAAQVIINEQAAQLAEANFALAALDEDLDGLDALFDEMEAELDADGL
jgi:hypothetical protein